MRFDHNDPNYKMTDEEYLENMLDVIEYELELARDSAINGESNEDRQRHILSAIRSVQTLMNKTPNIPQGPPHPDCQF